MFEFAFYSTILALFLAIFGDKIFNTLVFNKEYKGQSEEDFIKEVDNG